MTLRLLNRQPRQRSFAIVTSRCRFGWFGVAAGVNGVVGVFLPRPTRKDLFHEIARSLGAGGSIASTSPSARIAFRTARNCVAALRRYFAGKVECFRRVLLDFTGLPDFRRRVYAAARDIPYGATVSYGELARCAGRPRAARAVGRAMAVNPFPIIVPCHRVIGADGSLRGFGGPGGLRQKRRLLELERRPVSRNSGMPSDFYKEGKRSLPPL